MQLGEQRASGNVEDRRGVWHRPGIPDTFDRWDDDIGGVRCKGSDTALLGTQEHQRAQLPA